MWMWFYLKILFPTSLADSVTSIFNVKSFQSVRMNEIVVLCTCFFHSLIYSRYVKNTPRSISLFNLAWENYQNNRNLRQQPALNDAIDVMLKEKLRMQLLPLHLFAPGWAFFEEMQYTTIESLPCK